MSVTPINIISATQTGEYLIRLRFDDQSEQEVNFKPFLTRSNHPDIRAYLDPVRFGAFGSNTANLFGATTIFASRWSIFTAIRSSTANR